MYFRILLIALVGFGCLFTSAPAAAAGPGGGKAGKVFMTMDEALELAFPKCKVERTRIYLSKDQQAAITKACGKPYPARMAFAYVAKRGEKHVGTAYFDTHKVRSLRQTLMVVVKSDGSVGRVELLAFAEPRQYIPKAKWYRQIHGQTLGAKLKLGKAVRPMGGATLTATATVDCARRILALHQVIEKTAESKKRAPKKVQSKKASLKAKKDSKPSKGKVNTQKRAATQKKGQPTSKPNESNSRPKDSASEGKGKSSRRIEPGQFQPATA